MSSATRVASPTEGRETAPAAFGRSFWFSYGANMSMTTAASLLYVYADFVHLLGGNEEQLGRIVGLGMLGGIAMRFVQGVGIDRIGPRQVWLWSTGLYALACALHLTI